MKSTSTPEFGFITPTPPASPFWILTIRGKCHWGRDMARRVRFCAKGWMILRKEKGVIARGTHGEATGGVPAGAPRGARSRSEQARGSLRESRYE